MNTITSPQQTDPARILKLFWRWKLLFLVCVVVPPAAAYVLTARAAKTYEATALVQEGPLPGQGTLIPGQASPTQSAVTNPVVLGGEARLIQTPSYAALAARRLNPPSSTTTLLGSITVTPDSKTGFISITAKAHHAQRAADVANAFAAAVVAARAQQAQAALASEIARARYQLRHLAKNDKTGRTQLSTQLQQLQAIRTTRRTGGAGAEVVEAATPPASASSPKALRAGLLGLVAGLLLGFGLVFVADATDRRLRYAEDLEELTGLPVLAVLPRTAFKRGKNDWRVREAFHMLRSALMFFNVERPLTSIVVASPTRGDGKTTVATGLAVAAAQAGRDVILVDADLRQSQAAARLGVADAAARSDRGLATVLAGQHSLEDALLEVPILDTGRLGGGLRLLPAGPLPPNPSELLASRRMPELLQELVEISDLIVIDTNSLLSVSDPLALLDLASGVVLVTRLNRTRKGAVLDFGKLTANTGAMMLGQVATGARGRPRYGRGYRPTPAVGEGRSGPVAPAPATNTETETAPHDGAGDRDPVTAHEGHGGVDGS